MSELTELIKNDMKPALGVTEPGAIALAVAKAASYTEGEPKKIRVSMNSGMYKNAFTCGIPNSCHVGNLYSAALGYIGGNPDRGLEVLSEVTEEDNRRAEELVDSGIVEVELSGITSEIFIEATVVTDEDRVVVTIKGAHENIVSIIVNDEVILEKEYISDEKSSTKVCQDVCQINKNSVHPVHKYSLRDLVNYVNNVDIDEILFVKEAYKVNMELFEAGIESDKTTFAKRLLEMNGGNVISKDERSTASLLCNAAIEARVIGLDKPAMSITGSGAHGIIATMPLYAAYRVNGYSEDMLLRATILSYLVCTYIKEYSGRLSAFCGCGIAAGTGTGVALVYMRGGSVEQMGYLIDNMASGITGMICDGGNQGCTMKGIAAVEAIYRSADFAMHDVRIDSVHGICGSTPEETMRNMGLIASPGMVGTEKTIVEIFENKL